MAGSATTATGTGTGRRRGLVRLRAIPHRLRRRLFPTPRQRAKRRRRQERERLLSMLPEHGVCAEVGTWRGDFAATILASRAPTQLYLVDPWEHREEDTYAQASFGGNAQGGQTALDAIHDSVVARFRAEIDAGRVIVRRQRSVPAAAAFAEASLDWVYIDADHSYEGVKGDLESYYRTVKPGGFLAGDDYGHVGSWFEDGVTRAVDEFAGRCAELKVIGTQFLLRKH
jgi:Methyltransferase domain